jgi:hypothetical protein
MSETIICLNCDKYHNDLTTYNEICELGRLITDKDSVLKPTFNEYLERKMPEFKGLSLMIGLLRCPKFIPWKREPEFKKGDIELLKKLGIKI